MFDPTLGRWLLWNKNHGKRHQSLSPFPPETGQLGVRGVHPSQTGAPRRNPADPRLTRNGNAASEGYSRGRESFETWQTRQALGSKFLSCCSTQCERLYELHQSEASARRRWHSFLARERAS